ncbi:arginyltransferase [bacterium]|nr:arginyltransferase [bacterium]
MQHSPMRLLDFGDCPYLPDRRWHSLALHVLEASQEDIQGLLFSGFRRLGHLYYTPMCEGCQACISLRIPAATFRPNKNQRQILRRNQDVTLEVEPGSFSQEKFALYQRYQSKRWDKQQSISAEEFCAIYLEQPGQGLDFVYRLEGQIVGVDLVDVSPLGISSVYFVWDCDPRRSLGIFSVMKSLEWCLANGREHLYLGLYVEGNDSMRYKATFHPHQRRYRGGPWADAPATGWPKP